MSEHSRAVAALGLAASLLVATSAFALEVAAGGEAPSGADAQQAVDLVSAGVAAKAANDPNCPTVTLAPDGDSRKSNGGKATLDALARDCANLGAETIVKVGVVGESTRRKKGDAGQVDAPMTIQIKNADGQEIETRRINLKVEMPEGVQKVSFQHVEENVSLPPPSADGYAKWTIVVGLDPAAGGAESEVASVDEQVEEPVAAPSRSRNARSGRSYRGKSARARAIRYSTSRRNGRQRIEVQPAPPAVVVSAKPQGAPAATVTTTTVNSNSGTVFTRAAQGFTERRDKALAEQQQRAAPAAPARPQQRAAPAAPTPPAPAARSAQAQPRGVAQPTQTN